MIVYSASKTGFLDDVMSNAIADKILAAFRETTGHNTGLSEIASWQNSMQFMYRIIDHEEIPTDAGVAIEYHIPQSSKRIEFCHEAISLNPVL